MYHQWLYRTWYTWYGKHGTWYIWYGTHGMVNIANPKKEIVMWKKHFRWAMVKCFQRLIWVYNVSQESHIFKSSRLVKENVTVCCIWRYLLIWMKSHYVDNVHALYRYCAGGFWWDWITILGALTWELHRSSWDYISDACWHPLPKNMFFQCLER